LEDSLFEPRPEYRLPDLRGSQPYNENVWIVSQIGHDHFQGLYIVELLTESYNALPPPMLMCFSAVAFRPLQEKKTAEYKANLYAIYGPARLNERSIQI
jgi:hypothetical protein